MMKFLFSITVVCLANVFSILEAQPIPTNNPYREMYGSRPGFPTAPYHWTDSIRWDNVFNIKDFQNLAISISLPNNDTRLNWLPAYNAARDAAAAVGGGVVYFPSLPKRKSENYFDEDSSYYFTDNVYLRSNVVLRGDKPLVNDAKNRKFSPTSHLEFPKYYYQAGLINGTPNSTAFKEITNDTAANSEFGKKYFKNTGLIYLDINRARIAAHPTFTDVTIPSKNLKTTWAKEPSANFIVFGVRMNNVAIPEPRIPSPNMNSWLRFPWQYTANIDVFVKENCIVCNNRLNDYSNNDVYKVDEDAFTMSNYNASGSCGIINQKFEYNSHYGIFLNRLKKTGYNSVTGFLSNSTPETEPALFAKGNVVCDNWIYKTSRVGIQAGGMGMEIKRNVIKDNPSKATYLSPTGLSCNTNIQATYENRGIDIAGWDIIVDSNDIEVYRTRMVSISDSVFSADGEGWYSQGPSGSTMRNYKITNNIVRTRYSGLCNTLNVASAQGKGFNGFYNTKDVSNILIAKNDFGGMPFRINANTSGLAGSLTRIVVHNNSNIHSTELLGNACGDSVYFYNNTSSCKPCNGIMPLRINQYVCLNADAASCPTNTNGPIPCLGNENFTGTNCGTNRTMCGLPLVQNFPKISFVSPTAYETITTAGAPILLEASFSIEFCNPDSVVFFNNGIRMSGLVTVNNNEKKATYSDYTAPARIGYDFIVVRLYKSNDQNEIQNIESNAKIIRTVTSTKALNWFESLKIFPNPAINSFTLQSIPGSSFDFKVEILDITGKLRKTKILKFNSEKISEEMSINDLASGVYFVHIQSGNNMKILKLLKEF